MKTTPIAKYVEKYGLSATARGLRKPKSTVASWIRRGRDVYVIERADGRLVIEERKVL